MTGTKTIGSAVEDDGREQLARGWQQLQAYGQSRLDELGVTTDEAAALVRRELTGRE